MYPTSPAYLIPLDLYLAKSTSYEAPRPIIIKFTTK
jgi:hypothetical protein